MESVIDADKLTDIELAMNFSRLIECYTDSHYFNNVQRNLKSPEIFDEMARDVLKTMKNPFAKKMVIDKIDELKKLLISKL